MKTEKQKIEKRERVPRTKMITKGGNREDRKGFRNQKEREKEEIEKTERVSVS